MQIVSTGDIGDNLHEISIPVSSENSHQFVVC